MHNDKFLCIMQLFSQHNIHPYLTTVINATNLSCITHQLNIIKCITKQYHEMIIEYLSFIRFMGRLHLDHSALSSSSFMKSSFLIQMIISIRGSSRIEFFFHIPHCLRDLLWMVRAWSSIAPIFFFSYY